MVKYTETIKDYKVNAFGYLITIPKGSKVSNKTACGPDNNYHFWQDFEEIAEKITGFKNSFLKHDLIHRGINIPPEYCKPYK